MHDRFRVEFLTTVTFLLLVMACGPLPSGNSKEEIVFSMDGAIWVMNPDGTDQHELLKSNTKGLNPQWSPDGRKLVFTSTNADQKEAVWIADSNGENPRPVTLSFDHITATWLNSDILLTEVITETGQSWNNPASQFTLDLRNQMMIGYLNDYAAKRPLASGEQWLSTPSRDGTILYSLNQESQQVLKSYAISGPWSFDVAPSGHEAVFYGARITDANKLVEHAVYVTRLDSSSEPAIKIFELNGSASVRWSPDGKWIAVLDQNSQLRIIETDHNTISKTYQLKLPIPHQDFQWAPDSRWLIIASAHYTTPQRDNSQELVKINRETGEVMRLTYNGAIESSPDWAIVQR